MCLNKVPAVCVVAALCLLAATALAQEPTAAAMPAPPPAAPPPAPPTGALPRACLSGMNIITICKPEINDAAQYFGAADLADLKARPQLFTQEKLTAYLANAPQPSATCCASTCVFNAHYCSCWPQVLSIAKQLTPSPPGVDMFALFYQVSAQRCTPQFTLYMNSTCPTDFKTAAPDPHSCASAPVNRSLGALSNVTSALGALSNVTSALGNVTDRALGL